MLIRVETKAGHGAGKPVAKMIEEDADIFAFVFRYLGVKWRRDQIGIAGSEGSVDRVRVHQECVGASVMTRCAVAAAMPSAPCAESGGTALPDLKTRPERTDFSETSHYDDVDGVPGRGREGVAETDSPDDVRQDVRRPRAAARRRRRVRMRRRRPSSRPASCASTSRGTSTPARSKARNRRRCCCASSPRASTPTG